MPPIVALLIGTAFILYTFRREKKTTIAATAGLFWPSLWYVVVATRPVGVWFYTWGIPLPGGSDDPTEGSSIDRYFFTLLTVVGLVILSRRRFSWGEVLKANPWVTAFLCFMALSILWSQYPFVSFKRFIKVIGSIVMAMVVLSSATPFESLLTVLKRCLFIHLPMSIICIRYYRHIGVHYEFNGLTEAWQGISTTKNTLGQIALIGALCFFWEVRRNWAKDKWRNWNMLYLLMAVYLLKGSDEAVSMTSLSVCIFAVFIFLTTQWLRNNRSKYRAFITTIFTATASLVLFIAVHSVVMFSEDSIFGEIITGFGRDITLTDRTFIWHDVYAAVKDSPLLGVGYGGFWIGRLANIPWNEHMTWVLGQGHSGYIDTYLQLGFVGIILMSVVLITTLARMLNFMDHDFDFGCFRVTLFMTMLFVNITESVYLRGDHHLWFVFMAVIWLVPASMLRPVEGAAEEAPIEEAREATVT